MADNLLPPGTPPPPVAPASPGRRGVVILAAVVAVFAVVAAVGFATRDRDSTKQARSTVPTTPGALSTEPTATVSEPATPSATASGAGGTASCAPVVDVPLGENEAVHRDGEIDYDQSPPSSGVHNPVPLRSSPRVVDPDTEYVVERAVHNLEHAYVVVWYDPDVTQRVAVAAALDGVTERKVIAVPWNRGGMGDERPYVLAAWGHTQDCTVLSAAAVEAFFAEHGGENGDAPEKNAL